ncbi:RNase L inhibitor protein [Enterocytozoon bieneusi H348]|nr:RNase L inhibitor protein [Enterocytozoon bieneusi H348]|eukprot:XP_002650430.1 RNase L inhibitor protein [Enterocytozoon bieneusi H348]
MIKKYIYEFNECDPKKCSGHKMVKLNKVISINTHQKFFGILLSPIGKKIFSKKDLNKINNYGIGLIDCSWNKIKEFNFGKICQNTPLYLHRILPLLIAANPINYGKPYKLNCVEALGGALYIVGLKDEAKKVFDGFSYGNEFFKINYELLEEYVKCETENEIRICENKYITKYT